MFKWLRKRQTNEQRKLLYQNGSASERLMQFFDHIGKPDMAIRMKKYEEENRRIALSVSGDEAVAPQDVTILLNMNRELRNLHDGLPGPSKSFDDEYKPILGWKDYYEN